MAALRRYNDLRPFEVYMFALWCLIRRVRLIIFMWVDYLVQEILISKSKIFLKVANWFGSIEDILIDHKVHWNGHTLNFERRNAAFSGLTWSQWIILVLDLNMGEKKLWVIHFALIWRNTWKKHSLSIDA